MADVGMPPATAPATPIAAISAIPIVPVSAVSTVLVSAIHTASIFMGPGEFLGSSLIFFLASLLLLTYGSSLGPLPIVPSQFEVGSSAIVLDPMGEVATFFVHFDQPEINDLDLPDFWGSGPPYVDFHGFRVP